MAERLIEELLDPGAYPERPTEVTLCQTHISYLFLTAKYVYKIKKPVDFGFLDFTTLDKRLLYCTEEVRLNRRLAPDIYLGVVPVALKNSKATMEAQGSPIEWAVKMRRLDEASILSNILSSGTIPEEAIVRIGHAIAEFHKTAFSNPRISGFGSPEVISRNTTENFSQTERYVGRAVSKEAFDIMRSYTERFISSNSRIFLERASSGYVRDCHGDLHCDHISIGDGIEIFDCIEFNERFRYSDVVADIAFLSMDLDFRNRPDLAKVLDDAYFASTNDTDGRRLMDFYKCYRALIRAKVDCLKSEETEVPAQERLNAFLSARVHFRLAREYSEGGLKPLLIISSGLSGTGKTTLSRAIASATGAVVISSDMVRKELAGISPQTHCVNGYGEGIYSPELSARTYAEIISRAKTLLEKKRTVILDATFLRNSSIAAALTAAKEVGADTRIIRCVCPEEIIRENILKRESQVQQGGASDAGWEVYLRQKGSLENIAEDHLVVDTSIGIEGSLRYIFEKIFD
ncbi:MAG: AAA family ATPase [Deltaproteobacteria bacterium]